MKRLSVVAALCIVLSATISTAAESVPPVRISGSTTVANSIVIPHQADIESAAKVKLDLTPSSSGAGIVELASGGTDIAMISSDLGEILEKVRKTTLTYNLDEARLQKVDVGQARIEFIVNASNPVKKLSAEQLKKIFLGKITNWKDVGGPAADIHLLSESRHGAMRAIIEHDLLEGEMSSRAAEIMDAPEIATAVARLSNGIGFISSATPADLRQGTVAVDTDVRLVQSLALVTKGVPSPSVARVIQAIAEFKK